MCHASMCQPPPKRLLTIKTTIFRSAFLQRPSRLFTFRLGIFSFALLISVLFICAAVRSLKKHYSLTNFKNILDLRSSARLFVCKRRQFSVFCAYKCVLRAHCAFLFMDVCAHRCAFGRRLDDMRRQQDRWRAHSKNDACVGLS